MYLSKSCILNSYDSFFELHHFSIDYLSDPSTSYEFGLPKQHWWNLKVVEENGLAKTILGWTSGQAMAVPGSWEKLTMKTCYLSILKHKFSFAKIFIYIYLYIYIYIFVSNSTISISAGILEKVKSKIHSIAGWSTDSGDSSSLMAVLQAHDCVGKIQKDYPC